MCSLACETSGFIMVDQWEVNQSTYQRTLTILQRVESSLTNGNIKVTDDLEPNQIISSTRVIRESSSRGFSIKYLTADGVNIDYVGEKGLHLNQDKKKR